MTDKSALTKRDRALREAEGLLQHGAMGSVKGAFGFLVGFATLAGLVGGGLALLQMFSGRIMGALVFGTLLTTIVAFVVLEFIRFRQCTRVLRVFVEEGGESEASYAALLAEARKERDEARAAAITSETRLALLVGAKQLLIAADSRSEQPESRRRVRAPKQIEALRKQIAGQGRQDG